MFLLLMDINGITDFTNAVGKYFTIAVLFMSAGTYLCWLEKDASVALYSAVSVLIIFCPCTLALAIPVGLRGTASQAQTSWPPTTIRAGSPWRKTGPDLYFLCARRDSNP